MIPVSSPASSTLPITFPFRRSRDFQEKKKEAKRQGPCKSFLRASSGPCRRAFTAVQCLTGTAVQPVRAPWTHPLARERLARGRACDTTAREKASVSNVAGSAKGLPPSPVPRSNVQCVHDSDRSCLYLYWCRWARTRLSALRLSSQWILQTSRRMFFRVTGRPTVPWITPASSRTRALCSDTRFSRSLCVVGLGGYLSPRARRRQLAACGLTAVRERTYLFADVAAAWEVAVGSTVAAAGACRSRVVRIHLRSHALVAPGLALPGHGVAKNVPTVKPSSGLVEHPSKCLFYPCEDRCLCDNFGRENVGLYKNTAKQHRRGV